MTETLAAYCGRRLDALRDADRWRRRLPATHNRAGTACIDGRELRLFCANDYLGLADHPAVIAAWRSGAERWGVGSGASQYISGYRAEQAALEEELADWVGRPRALVFGAGYLANPGVIDALVGRGDDIVSDALNHASLIDGCRLSGARVHRYAHGDSQALAQAFAACGDGNRLLVSDGVFSMDGDRADLAALVAASRAHGAWLMVDDAHGFGVLGRDGAGEAAALGCADLPVLTATLGKALGVFGAFAAGDEALIELLTQTARTAIFTTALPPALLAAVRAAVAVAREESWRRDHLRALIARFRAGLGQAGLPVPASTTPIQPLIVGDEAAALALSAELRQRGYWVAAIRPPTVPVGTSRLRVTLSAAHDEAAVDGLVAALAACWPRPAAGAG